MFVYVLGKIVNVQVKGPLGKGTKDCFPFFYGYITSKDSYLYRKKVYIITNTNINEKYIKAQVIASVRTGGPFFSHRNLVVAPLGRVFYAPDIKSRFFRLKGKRHLSKMICLYEKSCGAIVFKDVGNTRYFLLIKHAKNQHWGFPKGHVEMYESDEQTAKREIKEETNLDVEILEGFRQLGFYRPYSVVEKKVVIFLAKVIENGAPIKVQRKEIDNYKWVTEDEVIKQLYVGNEAMIFKSAIKWLNSQQVLKKIEL